MKFLLLLLLVGCTNYAKPFAVSDTIWGCEDSKQDLEQLALTHIDGEARSKCIANDYVDVEMIKNTSRCSLYVKNFELCADSSRVSYAICSADFLCKKE